MKLEIKYIGSGGEINLSQTPVFYAETDFFRRQHNYSLTPLISGRGSKKGRFYRDATEYTLNLNVIGETKERAHELINEMDDLFERDVYAETPGRLYVNDYYVNCYVVSSESTDRIHVGNMFFVALKILVEQPLWIREEVLSFGTFTASSGSGFILPTAIPFGLTSNAGIRQLIIDHHASVRAEICMFGPAVNPSFSIGGNIYQVNGTLLAGERFVINQLEKKVTKITNSGEVINAFNLRSKTYSVFEPIPTGESLLTYTGEFAISLNLFYERGEPRWN